MEYIKYFKDYDGHLYCIRLKEYHSGVNRLFFGRSITGFSPASDDTAFVHLIGRETVRVSESYKDILQQVVLHNSSLEMEELQEWARST